MVEEQAHVNDVMLSELREMMEGEFEFLVETFIEDSRQRLEDIHRTLEEGNAVAFSRACHSLKGSATNLGLPRLSDLCKQGEELGHGGNTDSGRDLVSAIESEFTEVVQLLQDYL